MLKAEPTSTRAPRGTKPVSQAFFTALDAVPEATRAAVAKAAQVMIRDELKVRKEKMKAAAVKEKARKPAAPAKMAKTAKAMPTPKAKPAKMSKAAAPSPVPAAVNGAAPAATSPKRRARKPADVPTTA